jgi:hypothetical protein
MDERHSFRISLSNKSYFAVTLAAMLLLSMIHIKNAEIKYFASNREEIQLGGIVDKGPVAQSEESNPPRLCRIDEIVPGKWINATYSHAPYVPMRGEVQQKTCSDFDPNADIWQTWEWMPHAVTSNDCLFSSNFDKDQYCALTSNKTVAIIGDSISFDHYLSLTHLLGLPKALPKARNKFPQVISEPCNGTSKLIGQRDFLLTKVGDVIQTHSPDVIILNRGAHYTTDDALQQHFNHTLIRQLETWQAECIDKSSKQCLLIWWTTVPGHPNFDQYTHPAESITEMEYAIKNHSNAVGYNWDKFQHQNKLVLDLLARSSLDFEIMDAYDINILRPDAHAGGSDCLHSCLPGDDIYSYITQHMLQLKFEQE